MYTSSSHANQATIVKLYEKAFLTVHRGVQYSHYQGQSICTIDAELKQAKTSQ